MTEWRILPNTNELYMVSNQGQIKRVKGKVRNNINGGERKIGGKVLSQKTKSNGYKEVNLYVAPQVSKMTYVHRAVVSAFVGVIPEGAEVNHKDGNKGNNKIENLEIVTPAENCRHAADNGLLKAPVFKGSAHGMARLTEDQVLMIRKDYAQGKTPTELSKLYKKPFGTICKICYRQTWKHI